MIKNQAFAQHITVRDTKGNFYKAVGVSYSPLPYSLDVEIEPPERAPESRPRDDMSFSGLQMDAIMSANVTDMDGRKYYVMCFDATNPGDFKIRIKAPEFTAHTVFDRDYMRHIRVVDSQGNLYKVLDAEPGTESGTSAVLYIDPGDKLHSYYIKRVAQYVRQSLMDYDLLNHECSVGRARRMIDMIVGSALKDCRAPVPDANAGMEAEEKS